MSAKSVFITGANRGIGLELIKQYLGRNPGAPKHLFAGYRTMSDELKQLGDSNPSLVLVKMDLTDYNGFPAVAKQVEDVVGAEGLNLLINNAGVIPLNSRELDTLTPEAMVAAFEVNCVGPLFLTKAMLPLLKTAAAAAGDDSVLSVHRAAAIQMSTAVGSIAENGGGKNYAYRCSKTALNMAMKNLSLDLAGSGVLTMAIHPGWVKTDMGGANAMITAEACVTTMLETLDGLTEKDHGTFLRYNNTPIQW